MNCSLKLNYHFELISGGAGGDGGGHPGPAGSLPRVGAPPTEETGSRVLVEEPEEDRMEEDRMEEDMFGAGRR